MYYNRHNRTGIGDPKPQPKLKVKKGVDKNAKPKSDLQQLVRVADALHSKELRMKSADPRGIVECFTCPTKLRWQDAHCGHFITRSCYALRWDIEVNTKVQCPYCNIVERGNLVVFANKLDEQHGKGTADRLLETAKVPFKLEREFVQKFIDKYKKK